MELSPGTPTSDSKPAANAARRTLRAVAWLVLVALISAVSAYGVFEWQIRREQASTATQVQALRDDLRQRQDQLDQRMAQVEKAAETASILFQQNGQSTSLDARLKEIDAIKLDLQKSREETDAKLKAMEQSVVEQVAKQGKETAQALSQQMKAMNLVVKAQSEVLLAQVHWSEGNRGLAKDELSLAAASLQQALDASPESGRAAIKQVLDQTEQTRTALILEQSSARDSLNLLWHQVGDLLAPAKQ